jgi:hypothetical protein
MQQQQFVVIEHEAHAAGAPPSLAEAFHISNPEWRALVGYNSANVSY